METPQEGESGREVTDTKVVTKPEEPEVEATPKEAEKPSKVCTSGDTDDVPTTDPVVVVSKQTAGGDCLSPPGGDAAPAASETKEPEKAPVDPEKRVAALEKELQRLHRSEAEKSKHSKQQEERLRSFDKRYETLQMSNCHLAEVNSYLCQRAIQLEQALHHMGIDPTSIGRRLKAELRNKVLTPFTERQPLSAEEVAVLSNRSSKRRRKRRGKPGSRLDQDGIGEENNSRRSSTGDGTMSGQSSNANDGGAAALKKKTKRRNNRFRGRRQREVNWADVLLVTDCYSRTTLNTKEIEHADSVVVRVKPLRCDKNILDATEYISHADDWQPLKCLMYLVGSNDLRDGNKTVQMCVDETAELVSKTQKLLPDTHIALSGVLLPDDSDEHWFSDRAAEFNAGLRQMCDSCPLLHFVDNANIGRGAVQYGSDGVDLLGEGRQLLLGNISRVVGSVLELFPTSPQPPPADNIGNGEPNHAHLSGQE